MGGGCGDERRDGLGVQWNVFLLGNLYKHFNDYDKQQRFTAYDKLAYDKHSYGRNHKFNHAQES